MDKLSLAGVLLALIALLGGNWLEGGQLQTLMNGPAFLIVIGGSVGAVLLQTPWAVFAQAMQNLKQVFRPPELHFEERLKVIVGLSQRARHEGLLGLERAAGREKDPFVAKGMQLLVNGSDPKDLRRIMELEIDARERRDLLAARVFESLGGYTPTIGIIGAVMGLIHVMQNLAEPAKLGSGIATAFVATVYGVGFANLLFLPIANKLKNLANAQSLYREMVVEGLVGISEGENPRLIEARLRGFLE